MRIDHRRWALWTCRALACSGALLAFSSAASAKFAHEPAPGSPERKAILNAFRQPVEKRMRQAVVFHDVYIQAEGDWAYANALARDPAGKPLRHFAGGPHDLTFQALLHKERAGWRVLEWGWADGNGPTDKARSDYPQAPGTIFGDDADSPAESRAAGPRRGL